MDNPCQSCGACCAYFRVSFYWSEAVPELGGTVPPELTAPLNATRCAMAGTLHAPTRCVALEGQIGTAVACRIYPLRSSTCRELEPWDDDGQPNEKCARARSHHQLEPLPSRETS